jgi:hypothetical protein
MLRESDERWLHDAHPTLAVDGNAIAGTIKFRASYDRQANRFVILDDSAAAEPCGLILAGEFDVRIEERDNKSDSRFPALYVRGIAPVPDRHFSQGDKSACLCSPLEEDEFLEPEFHFRLYVEQLAIPFLYGQMFYSSHGRWPWREYAHGGTGLLEAYASVPDDSRAEECLRKLERDGNWARIRSALLQEPYMKGHTQCFCPAMDQIRRCHPAALSGALLLQRHLRARGISIT